VKENNFDNLLRGHVSQSLQEFNNVYSEEMTEWLFATKDFGLDIVSLNVQRGRDHQIPGYTTYKHLCGFGPTSTWNDMKQFIDSEHVHRLTHTYKSPEDVDTYIAMSMERPVSGTLLGPTTKCLIQQQFKALQMGDRFFFTNPGLFSDVELNRIKSQSLASIMCANADDATSLRLQPNVFKKPDLHSNPLKLCSTYSRFELDMIPSGSEVVDANQFVDENQFGQVPMLPFTHELDDSDLMLTMYEEDVPSSSFSSGDWKNPDLDLGHVQQDLDLYGGETSHEIQLEEKY